MGVGSGIPGPARHRRDRQRAAEPPVAGRDRRSSRSRTRIEVFIQSARSTDEIRDALQAVAGDADPRSWSTWTTSPTPSSRVADDWATPRRPSCRERCARGAGEHDGAGCSACAPRAGDGDRPHRRRAARPPAQPGRRAGHRPDPPDRAGPGDAGSSLASTHMLSEIAETVVPPGPRHRRDAGRGDEELGCCRSAPSSAGSHASPATSRPAREEGRAGASRGRRPSWTVRVIEEIGDPLVHLLRNAIDHGVEAPADRLAAGKPEVATVD